MIDREWTKKLKKKIKDQDKWTRRPRVVLPSITDKVPPQSLNSDLNPIKTRGSDFCWDDQFDISFSVYNLTDELPPFTVWEMNYDAYTHSPLGRFFKAGFTYRMQ